MSLYQVRRDEGKFVQLDHAKRRRDREMAEIATAAARVGLSKQECEARALELESLLPELAPNLDKLKASDWALLLRDVEAVAVKIITLKVYFPGADVGKIVAKSPKVLLRSVEVLKEDAVQVRSMFGTRVHNLDAIVETCPDLLSPRQAALSIHNLQRWFPGKDVYKLLETDPTLLQNIEEATLQADPTYDGEGWES